MQLFDRVEMMKMIARIGTMLLLLACAACAASPGPQVTFSSGGLPTAELAPDASGFVGVPGPNVGEPGAAGSYSELPPGTSNPSAE